MKKFGLIGFPLEHSFSKKYFEEKFRREHITGCSYELFPLPFIEGFLPLIELQTGLCGLNVTIPYKESIIAYLDELGDFAKGVGAVNCIKIVGGKLIGYNTDAIAFEKSLRAVLNNKPAQAFILGTGGASKAVSYVLGKMKIDFVRVSRLRAEHAITYNRVPEYMKESNLFINTTPLGMFPEVEHAPDIPYHKLTNNDYLFDLVYNPDETRFMQRGKAQGTKTKNGYEMLVLQAEESWKIWNS